MKNVQLQNAVEKMVNYWNAIPTSAVEIIFTHENAKGNNVEALTEDGHKFSSEIVAYPTMYMMSSSAEEDWVRNNIEIMRDLGINVYESESLGIVIGVDNVGYDMNEEHWTPLYEAMGYEWHLHRN
ncbi:hypothetical protein [Bacillus sp. NPDC094106]|uniref:hypothetical protein n=1 Tax=Bacillus sp. NPDC094106 TaxID=3363949 RepID=UPI00381E2C40